MAVCSLIVYVGAGLCWRQLHCCRPKTSLIDLNEDISMADIFDEVDEEQRENTQALWSRYGKFVIAAVAAVILAVGSAQGFKAWETKQAETAANAYQLP